VKVDDEDDERLAHSRRGVARLRSTSEKKDICVIRATTALSRRGEDATVNRPATSSR
jgi:hypothetical protein